MKISHLVYSSFSSTCVHIQPIPIGVTFSKARSSKLERLFCHVSVKRDFQALSFELWALKQHLKMSPQVGLAVQDGVYKMARWGMSKDIFMYETKPYTRHLHVWRQETYMYGVGSCKRDIWKRSINGCVKVEYNRDFKSLFHISLLQDCNKERGRDSSISE